MKELDLGGLRISPPLVLAPMVGLSHSALRTLIAELGGIGLLSTEMLGARKLPSGNPMHDPFLITSGLEHPLSYQMLVADPVDVPAAMAALHRLGADAVDLNLGCPAPTIRRTGAGSKLAEDQRQVRKVVAAARQATRLPLSAKIRLGNSLDEERLRDFCLMLEGEGLDYLTVHARLHKEPFSRKPRWDWVGKVKGWLTIPVLANGGIFTVTDAARCLEVSGADGLMIGRAAPTRPWLFAEISHALYGGPPAPFIHRPTLYRRFVELLTERFPPRRQLGRLKEFSHYFSKNYPFGHHLAMAIQNSHSVAEAGQMAEKFFARHDDQST
ncbi:MAG: dihydrouridine synthase [Desulfobulbaceae bacterium]|nr:MAG: dihydrouridine synthase [Desulfobulbaceae bacterium]